MAWQKPKPNRTFGIVAAISIQALLVAGLAVGLRIVDIPKEDGPLILVPSNDHPTVEPPTDPGVKPDDSHLTPKEEQPPDLQCPDCDKPKTDDNASPPGPSGRTIYPTPAYGSGKPDYPATDIRLGHQGQVVIDLCVDENGDVTSAQLEASSGYPTLDRSAVDWARRIHWRPGTEDGRPKAMCFKQPYRVRSQGSKISAKDFPPSFK